MQYAGHKRFEELAPSKMEWLLASMTALSVLKKINKLEALCFFQTTMFIKTRNFKFYDFLHYTTMKNRNKYVALNMLRSTLRQFYIFENAGI